MVENNWFTTNLYERSADNHIDFQIKFEPYEFVDRGFYKNCDILAQQLYDRYKNLYICYSGGMDSEFVLKVFVDLGIPITPVVVTTPYTSQECQYAFKYCNSRSIKYETMHLGDECIQLMKEKSLDRGLFSLLGAIPLLVCDYVNQVGGKLITGYGEPFTTLPGIKSLNLMTDRMEFCEWDYYLDAYDNTHPSGFFTYSLPVFYSLVNEIDYNIPTQIAKCNLYKVKPRHKMFPEQKFYDIFKSMRDYRIKKYNYFIQKHDLLLQFDKYRKT